jgi:hypothetical protein
MTVSGDSLIGRLVGGESIREVYGNVVLNPGRCYYHLSEGNSIHIQE